MLFSEEKIQKTLMFALLPTFPAMASKHKLAKH
jgi:hypothetical protein